MTKKNILFATLFMLGTLLAGQAMAGGKPILLIGASYGNGNTPLDSNLQGPLFGISVGSGDYVDLGMALTRYGVKVKNEAQAGATTFSRVTCNPVCGTAPWDSYENQFQKALLRVALYGENGLTGYNADYLVISIGNDCLHSDSFGIEQSLTSPCTDQELNEVVDRLIALGQQALDLGITPVYSKLPKAKHLDLTLFGELSGLHWMATPEQFDYLGRLMATRISNEFDGALLVDSWRNFRHFGDGLHPDDRTSMRAAGRILWAIQKDQWFKRRH